MGIEKFEIAGVVDDPAHQVAGLLVVEESQMHAFQLVIGPGPQVADQIPGSLVSHVVAHKAEKDPGKIKTDQDQCQIPDLDQTVFIHAFLNDAGHGRQHLRGSQIHQCQGKGGKNRQDIQTFVAYCFPAQFP